MSNLSLTDHWSPKGASSFAMWLKKQGAEHDQQLSRVAPCCLGTGLAATSAPSASTPTQMSAKVKWSMVDTPETSEEHDLFYLHHDFHYQKTFQGTKSIGSGS